MQFNIRPAIPAEYDALSHAAREIWLEHYTPIIGAEQVHYMIDNMQSPSCIKDDIKNGYVYWIASLHDKIIGYCAVQPRKNHLYLSKLYIRREHRGQGLARNFLDHAFQLTRKHKLPAIRLNVNKHNSTSIAAYEHMGFTTVDNVVNDIGNGYVMDDYVMELELDEE